MGLKERVIYIQDDARFPMQLTEQDLLEADQIIALDEREHRPLLERRFPGWENQVEYWHIPDINRLPANEALHTIEAKVNDLIVRFS